MSARALSMADVPAFAGSRATVSSAVLWGGAIAAIQKIGGIVVSLVLVRLLSAEVYGQYGLVNASLMFVYTFSMQRFMEHSFHAAERAEESDPSHLGFGIVLHLAIFAVFNAVCATIAYLGGLQGIAHYIHIGSLGILLNVPRIFYSTHLRRALDWRRQRLIHLVSFTLSAAGSIGLALAGYGVAALLASNLLVPVPYLIDLVWRRRDLLACRFDFSSNGQAFRFGLTRSGSAMVQVGQVLVEASLFTATAGFASFGIYGRAIGLGALATAWVTDQVGSVMYPVLAKVPAGSGAASRAAGLMLRLAVWTSVPAALAIGLAGEAAVTLLYGPGWSSVVPLLPPAVCAAVCSVGVRSMALMLLTTGGARAAFISDLALLAVYGSGLLNALPVSMLAYCWYVAAGMGLVLVGQIAVLVLRKVLVPRDVASAIVPMALVTAAALVAAYALDLAAFELRHPALALAVTFAATGLLALAAVRAIDPKGMASACFYLPGGSRIAGWLRLSIPPEATV